MNDQTQNDRLNTNNVHSQRRNLCASPPLTPTAESNQSDKTGAEQENSSWLRYCRDFEVRFIERGN